MHQTGVGAGLCRYEHVGSLIVPARRADKVALDEDRKERGGACYAVSREVAPRS